MNKTAIIDGTTDESRTFGEYHTTMCSLAASLSDLGITSISKVALFCPNNVDYVPISLSVTMIGAKLVPINPAFKVNELEKILSGSKAEAIFVHSSVLDVALQAIQNVDCVKHVIVIPDASGDCHSEGIMNLNDMRVHDTPWHESAKNIKTSKHFAVLPYSR